MTNRQKLIETNIYDLLCNMNKAMSAFDCECVIVALTGEYAEECEYNCGECIAKWLNEGVG